MNKYRPEVFSILYRISFIGLPIIALAVFFFLTKSSEVQSSSVPTEQNLVLGRLAYGTLVGTFSGPQFYVRSANSDGTGVVTLTDSIPPSDEPTWSPDGTKIAYIAYGNNDIYVMNANGTNKTNLTNSMGVSEANPSWSPAGKIVYERSSQIWIMNADGSNQMQFAGITQPSPTGPTWSADGTKIAFSSGGEIWKINADGTNEQRVTTNATADTDPSWSPDGARIVFSKSGSGIALVNADGTNEMNLTNISGDVKPAWSPDGTTIAFRRNAAPNGIYLMDATGGNQVRIIADTQTTPSIFSTNDNPAWQPVAQAPNTFTISGRITRTNVSLGGVTVNLSGTTNATATTDAAGNYQFSGLAPGGSFTISPSLLNHFFTPPNRSFSNLDANKIADFTGSGVCVGSNCTQNGKIAFVRNNDIYTVNQDGTSLTNITNSATIDSIGNWSPDGSKMIFGTDRDGNIEIYRMNADGSSPVRLTNNAASDFSPYYSPDGASIIFISTRDGNNEIYKMNADGTDQVRLTNDTVQQNVPEFSPDGQKIIFVVVSNQLWVMNADGTNQQQFQNPPGASHYYNHPSYSPNGQKIIFNYGDDITTAQTWTMNADGTNRVVASGGRSPSYSPDGLKVVGSSPFVPGQGIYTSNADGTNSLRITTDFDTLPDWQPISVPRRTAFDFDGDARSDIGVFRPSNGAWYLLQSTAGLWVPVWGLSTDVVTPADYDGDLKTDVAIWRPSDGNFYILNSFDGTVRIENFGLAGDIPTGGDFDGDGKAEVAVYRNGAQSYFYYRATMGNPNRNITFVPWGVTDDKPVAGDYDGDGRTDAAVFRPSNGIWYVRRSSDAGLTALDWGLATDKLVPADYDADGKTDFAVFRDGVWYLHRTAQGATAFQFGIANDVPAPADYDGDGKADVTVYRDGVWWILKSGSGNAETVQLGIGSDKPVPAAFVR
jgi:Tol biopolymer transport system component